MNAGLRLQRLWWQLRYLRPRQVAQRLHLRLRRPGRLAQVATPAWQAPRQPWVTPAPLTASWDEEGFFRLLGGELRWSPASLWGDRSPGKKRLMELNTCNWLWSAGPSSGRRLLADWVATQSRPDGPGWHPYITSQRIVNWVKWGLAGHELDSALRASLAQQLRYLEPRLAFDECDHKLINNAKALLFAGHSLADPQASQWRARGLRLLAQYLPELLLDDGGYSGRSPMYHNALLLDLLDMINLLRAYGQPLPDGLETRCNAALRWSRALCHADHEPALFNDAALDVVPGADALTAYGRRLGLQGAVDDQETASCWLPASGVGRLRAGPALLLADLGPLGPDHAASHGHAGTLGFELSLAGQRVLVDTGLSTYEDLRYRAYERSTAAHNTVVVDGKNSSDVWGLFKLGRRARIVAAGYAPGDMGGVLHASHDGYSRARSRLIHHREWSLCADRLTIDDVLEGAGEHRVDVYFHLHPDLTVELRGSHLASIGLPDGRCLELAVDPQLTLGVEDGYRATRFGERQPSKVLRAQAELTFPVRLRHVLTGWRCN